MAPIKRTQNNLIFHYHYLSIKLRRGRRLQILAVFEVSVLYQQVDWPGGRLLMLTGLTASSGSVAQSILATSVRPLAWEEREEGRGAAGRRSLVRSPGRGPG